MDTNEKNRLKELGSYQILDTASENEYNAITRLATYLCHTPIAYISFIDEKRVWLKAKIGVAANEISIEDAYCHFLPANEGIIHIHDAPCNTSQLLKFKKVYKEFNYQFFAGVPLINSNGFRLGTLCIIDHETRKLDTFQIDGLKILGDEIIAHLEMRRKNRIIQKTLLKNQQIYKMFDTSAEIHCVMDQDTNLIMINHTVEKILGYKIEDCIGHPIWKFLIEEEIPGFLHLIETGIRNGQKHFELEARVKTKSGETKWLGWTVAVDNGKWFANGRDISYHKKVVEELEQLSLVASKTVNGVIISNDNDNVIWVNDAFEEITGYNLSDLQGHKLGDLLQGEKTDTTVIEGAREHTRNKKSFAIDVLAYRKDGQPIWLSILNSVILNAEGEIEKEIEVIIDITSRKNSEQELETLSMVASKSSTGVVIRDAEGRVTWVNKALENILGFTSDELIGNRLGDVVSGTETNTDVLKDNRENRNKKKPYSFELLIYKKDGTPLWVFVSITPILNTRGEIERQVEIVVDITERKNAEEKLTLLSLVASKTVNGVVICDSDGKISWVNEAFEKLTGYKLEEFKSYRLGDIVSGEETDMNQILLAREQAVNLRSSEIELLIYKKDGTSVWVSISNTPTLNIDGTIDRHVKIINDISERKQAEQELINTREEALRLSKAKEAFLSVMSHEIRTPLNAVIGMSNILMDDNPTEKQIDNLKILSFSAQNLLSLINDVLDFTKIETGNMALERANVNIKNLVTQTLSTLKFKTVEKGVILRSEIDNRIADQVLGDNTRLYQILINLLANAIKFTEKGEVVLKLKLEKENSNSISVRFEVSDTGIGIPADKLDYIFESYSQASTDTTRKYGGTGLGLAITKRLVELHKSSILVTSELGKGSTFGFTIDFERSEQMQVNFPPAIAKPNSLYLNSTVLVVDDNEINRFLTNKVLSKWGVKVDFAENGEIAVDKVQLSPYDLVLMDLQMPVMNGMDATRAIRKLPGDYYQNLPIIALTASILNNSLDKIYACGMNDFLIKPFIAAELLSKIQTFLKN